MNLESSVCYCYGYQYSIIRNKIMRYSVCDKNTHGIIVADISVFVIVLKCLSLTENNVFTQRLDFIGGDETCN